jgi:hypothetical protein
MEYLLCSYRDLMKILVVGVGVHGSVIATELVRSPKVFEVMLGKGEIKPLGVIPLNV